VYTIIISVLAGIVIGTVYTLLGLWKTWAMGIILGTLGALGCFMILSRVLARRFEPAFLQAQKQIQSGANQLALHTLESLLPLGRWQIMLTGQIYAQMGLLAYAMEKEDQAKAFLEKAALRAPDARLALAAIQFRRKQYDEAFETLDVALRANKKQVLLYNVYAYMLYKQGKREEAQKQLQKCLKIEPSNESTKDNLSRLQNDKKLNMKRFGIQWYGLKLEKMPASMRQYGPGMHRGMRQKQRRQNRRG
jgi:tetratricopeptide (TPR) repeat protein